MISPTIIKDQSSDRQIVLGDWKKDLLISDLLNSSSLTSISFDSSDLAFQITNGRGQSKIESI